MSPRKGKDPTVSNKQLAKATKATAPKGQPTRSPSNAGSQRPSPRGQPRKGK